MIRLNFVLTALFFSLFSIESFAPPRTFDHKLADVTTEVDPDVLEDLTPEQRTELYAQLAKIAEKLFAIGEMDTTPPQSDFDPRKKGEQIIALTPGFNIGSIAEDLIRSRDAYMSKHGGRVPQEFWNNIQREAIIVVPSVKFPGQFHTWKIKLFFQEGAKSINLRMRRALDDGITQLVISVPARFVGTKPGRAGFIKGLRHALASAGKLWSFLVGRTETVPFYNAYEVSDIIQRERQDYLLDKQFLDDLMLGDRVERLDLRLFDPGLSEKIAGHVYRVTRGVDKIWETRKHQIVGALSPRIAREIPDLEKRVEAIRAALETEYVELLINALHQDTEINADPDLQGIVPLLIDQTKAVAIINTLETAFDNSEKTVRAEVEANVVREHSLKSRNMTWRLEEVQRRVQSGYQSRRWTMWNEAVRQLQSNGLSQQAALLKRTLEYARQVEPNRRAELEAKTKPAREFSFNPQLWLRKNWTVACDEEEQACEIQDYATETVETSGAWRARVVGRTIQEAFKTGNHWLFWQQFINGPLGVRSLFANQPFPTQYTLDEQNQIVPDTQELRSTLASNWRSISEWTRNRNRRYDQTEHNGILSGPFISMLVHGWNHFVGGIVKLGLVTLKPTATVIQSAITLPATATSPIWAPLSGVFSYGFDCLYDRHSPNNESASGSHGLGRALLPLLAASAGAVTGGYYGPDYLPQFLVDGGWVQVIGGGIFGLGFGGFGSLAFRDKNGKFNGWLPALGMGLGFGIGHYSPDLVGAWEEPIIAGGLGALTGGALGLAATFPNTLAPINHVGETTLGVLEAGTALGMGTIGHPLIAVGYHGAYVAGVKGVGRHVYDWFWRAVIGQFLFNNIVGFKVPGVNQDFLSRRVSGPGISDDYFFRINADYALLALTARLSELELNDWEAAARELNSTQIANYRSTVAPLRAAVGEPLDSGAFQLRRDAGPTNYPPGAWEILQSYTRLAREIENNANGRREILGAITSPQQGAKERIKMTQADLEKSITEGSVVVEHLCRKLLFPFWDEEKIARFWHDYKVLAEDWQGLTRAMLAEMFGNDILESKEETDKSLVVNVAKPGVAELVLAILSGRELDLSTTKIPDYRSPVQQAAVPYHKIVSSHSICLGALYDSAQEAR